MPTRLSSESDAEWAAYLAWVRWTPRPPVAELPEPVRELAVRHRWADRLIEAEALAPIRALTPAERLRWIWDCAVETSLLAIAKLRDQEVHSPRATLRLSEATAVLEVAAKYAELTRPAVAPTDEVRWRDLPLETKIRLRALQTEALALTRTKGKADGEP